MIGPVELRTNKEWEFKCQWDNGLEWNLIKSYTLPNDIQ